MELTSKFYSSKRHDLKEKLNLQQDLLVLLCFFVCVFNASKRDTQEGREINNGAKSREDGNKKPSRVNHAGRNFMVRNGRDGG